MARIACPYCCTIQTFPNGNRCDHCSQEVPAKYVAAARKTPPFYLAVVGMTAHGKTTFLNSLANAMDNFSEISDGAFLEPLDDKTVELMRMIRGQIASRTRTESTQPRARGATLQEPLLFTLKAFMTDGTTDRHTLVIYDLAGESFRDRAEIQEYAEPLKLCHTIWFVVSLYDLETQGSEYGTIAELFNIYVTGMERIHATPRGRRLHVIYSKADKLINRLDSDIISYVRDEDEYVNLSKQSSRELEDKQFNQVEYIHDLQENSRRLYDYTRRDVRGGKAFINMVKDNDMELSFSMNTATGSDPSVAVRDFEAYRVIDPLVWALRENVALGPQGGRDVRDSGSSMVLILDTGLSSRSKIYGTKLPSLFFTGLSNFGNVATYYLGHGEPMTQVGLAPTDEPPRDETINLIGPILDRLSPSAKILLVTCRHISDMVDFHTPEWHERMAIITFDDKYLVRRNDYYPYGLIFERNSTISNAEQVRTLVNRLFKPPAT